ncbi:MAG: nucleotidyltransferase family protein [bacterium]
MKEREKIIQKLKELKPDIEKKYKITEIGIFGSYVREEQNENSDVDILVAFTEDANMSLFKFCSFESWLSEILGKKVDLVIKSGIKPALKKYILNEVIYI